MVDGDHGRHGVNGIVVLLIAERKDQVHRQKPDHDPECVIIHHQDVTENHVLDQVYNTIDKPAILIVAEVSYVKCCLFKKMKTKSNTLSEQFQIQLEKS
jgi:hypothetical protein